MSTAKDAKARHDARRRRKRSGDGNALPGGAPGGDGPGRSAVQILAEHQIELLEYFALRADGWLRLIPDGDGKLVYLKWKYTAGRWRGYYGFVSGNPYNIVALLDELREQLLQHAEGVKRPTLDRPYS